MAQDIKVPEVSEGVTEGTVISLSVAEGDTVEVDQTLLELETDKAVVGLPAPFAGRITEIAVSEGDTVSVGDTVMKGEPADGGDEESETAKDEDAPQDEDEDEDEDKDKDKDEDKDEEKDEDTDEEKAKEQDEADEREPERDEAEEDAQRDDGRKPKKPPREEPPDEKGPRRREPPDEEEPPREEPPEEEEPARREPPDEKKPPRRAGDGDEDEDDVDLSTVRTGDQVAPAAPSVRRIARELGVDIYQVQGSGPGGRISEDDVRAFVRETMQRVTGGGPDARGEFAGLHAQRPLPDFTKWGPVTTESMSKVRQITADAMAYGWSTIPMVTQEDRADVTGLEDFRSAFNAKADDEAKLTMTAVLVKVCATALRAFPQFNSSLDLARKEIILKDYVHVGVAVDTPRGLLVPVIRDADEKGIERIAVELNELAAKTREGRISPADMEGGTFSISNLGGIGGTNFTPLVYAPQVAILGVSRASTEPVWDGDAFAPRLVMPLSLTYDHRAIDGADGARFLRWICAALTDPIHLAMKG